jgi:hypothetical protein
MRMSVVVPDVVVPHGRPEGRCQWEALLAMW